MSEVRAAAESARLRRRRNSPEELSCVRGQGRRLRGATLHPSSVVAAVRSSPASEVRVTAGRRHLVSEVRGGQEKPPCARGQGR